MKNLRSQNKVKAEGGMSSMTDLVFLLLIFFIILSTQVDPKPEVTINYPSAGNDDPNSNKTKSTIVGLDANNLYYIGKSSTPTPPEELETQILISVAQLQDSTIEIHGDKDSDLGFAMDVVNICKDNRLKLVFKREAK